jgi:hypothetical protein
MSVQEQRQTSGLHAFILCVILTLQREHFKSHRRGTEQNYTLIL